LVLGGVSGDGQSNGENFGFQQYKMAAGGHLGYTKMAITLQRVVQLIWYLVYKVEESNQWRNYGRQMESLQERALRIINHIVYDMPYDSACALCTCWSATLLCSEVWIGEEVLLLGQNIWQLFT